LLKYVDETFVKTVFGSFKGDPVKETGRVDFCVSCQLFWASEG